MSEAAMPVDDELSILTEAGDDPDVTLSEVGAFDSATDELDALTDPDTGTKSCAEHARAFHVVHVWSIGGLVSRLDPLAGSGPPSGE